MHVFVVIVLEVLSSYICAETISVETFGDGVTQSTHEAGVDVRDISWIHFLVKGCNDGIIKLDSTSTFDSTDQASIVLGGWGNDKCVMYPCSGCGAAYSVQHPFLNCNEYRPMWLNWTDNTLSIGTGYYVGENTFMSTSALRTFDVNYLGVTSTWNAVFDWQFYGPAGDYYERIVPAGISSRPKISTQTAASLGDCVRLCRVTRACKTVNYQQGSSTCHLTAERPRSQDVEEEPTSELWFERDYGHI